MKIQLPTIMVFVLFFQETPLLSYCMSEDLMAAAETKETHEITRQSSAK